MFFIGYNYIFVWHPWAGRLFISFASLMMINFAMLINFNNYLNKKIIFNTIFTIILIISFSFSFIDLFFNEFATIIPYKNKSIFSVSYDDRRYYKVNPQMGRVNDMINSALQENSKIGLLTGGNDWDYIYFGKNFKRNINYVNDYEYKNNDIKSLLSADSLDAIIINTKFSQEFYKQLFTHQILQISGANFIKYFKPLNKCMFLIKNNNLYIKVSGDDSYFENINELNFSKYKPLLISIDLYSDEETVFQIYYKNKNEDYKEENSTIFKIVRGDNKVIFLVPNPETLKNIRIDPTNIKNDIIIKKIDFLGIDENFKYKIESEFLIIY